VEKEISGVLKNRQQVEGRKKDNNERREGEMEAWFFSCLARLRSGKWSVGELDAETSYQNAILHT
jgi:hypothetical protein